MELRVISTEIIKPSSPTPRHLKTYNLSMIDQLLKDGYFPLIFFYSKLDKSTVEISDRLKKSLSEILVQYHPLAGHLRDASSVDCDDKGVPFVEAHIGNDMCQVLKSPEINILEQLVPSNFYKRFNLAIQINHFDCGGVAICAYFGHAVTDATTAANFVRDWAKVASGSSDIKVLRVDGTSIFPPSDLTASFSRSFLGKESPIEPIMKRFTFDGSKIAVLREKISNSTGSCLRHPTRFEAVAAVIWSAVVAVARESNESAPSAIIPMNLRNRMSPPLPPHSIGNIMLMIETQVMDREATDYESLARNIHESIKMVNGDYASKVKNDVGFVNELIKIFQGTGKDDGMFVFTSWGGLPFYEADFGWGKPTRMATVMRGINCSFFIDSSDGKGIEVWVGLSKQKMVKFEEDDGILTYASFDPTI